MAKGTNKAFLLGNVGKDPELRSTTGGTLVASFSLATADRQKDHQGKWVDKTEWHNLVAFSRRAEVVCDYVKKALKSSFKARSKRARGMTGNPVKRSTGQRFSLMS